MALFILNKTGRKNLILGGLFAISFALLLLFFGSEYYSNNTELFSVFLMVGFFLHVFCFSMSLGPINWIYPTEIVQPSLIPITTTTNWLSSWLLITLYPILRERAEDKSMPFMYLFFLACAVTKILICLKFMVETKGKTET
jgi:hypothetical protein